MSKTALLRLNDAIAKKINLLVEAKGIPFATICRSLIIERLKEIEAEGNPKRIGEEHDAL